ncbi:unnamed protein product [Closterium sp. NIES-64]|nr:unnamed protein product [Closterium sp. NIES-64]
MATKPLTLYLLVGAGVAGVSILGPAKFADLLRDITRVVSKHLKSIEDGSDSKRDHTDDVNMALIDQVRCPASCIDLPGMNLQQPAAAALMDQISISSLPFAPMSLEPSSQVHKLSLQVQQLSTSSRPITVVNAPPAQERGGSIVGYVIPVAVIGAAGYGVMCGGSIVGHAVPVALTGNIVGWQSLVQLLWVHVVESAWVCAIVVLARCGCDTSAHDQCHLLCLSASLRVQGWRVRDLMYVTRRGMDQAVNLMGDKVANRLSTSFLPIRLRSLVVQGWRVSDLMYVTRRGMDQAVKLMGAKVTELQTALDTAKKQLAGRLEGVSKSVAEGLKMQAIIKKDVIEVKGVVTSVSRDLDNMHGLVEGMLASLEQKQDIATLLRSCVSVLCLAILLPATPGLQDTKLASLEQKQDIATRGVLLLCSFVSRGLQGNPGNQELLKVRWGSFGGLWGLAHMPQMAVLQSATGKGITLQLSPALPCAPAICFPLILSGPGGHGLADMSQMAVPQLAAGKGAPAGGAVGLSGLKELEFISSALESSVHHTVVLSGLKELEFLSSAFESSPWCTTQWGCGCVAGEIVGSGASVGGAVGQWGSGAISLSGLKKLEFISSALESSVHHSGNLPLDPAYTYQPTRQASYQASTAERGMHGAAAAHGLHTAAPAAAQGLHASGATAEAAVVQSVREAGDVVLRRGVVIEEVGDGREGCGRPRPANEVSPPRAREGVPGGYPPRKLRHARFGD